MSFRESIGEQEWLKLKAAVEAAGRDGPFDATAALIQFTDTEWAAGNVQLDVPIPGTASIGVILNDMVELGYLRALGGNPPRWELTSEPPARSGP